MVEQDVVRPDRLALVSAKNLPSLYDNHRSPKGQARLLTILALYAKRKAVGMNSPTKRETGKFIRIMEGDSPEEEFSTSEIKNLTDELVKKGYLRDMSEGKVKSRSLVLTVDVNTLTAEDGKTPINVWEYKDYPDLTYRE